MLSRRNFLGTATALAVERAAGEYKLERRRGPTAAASSGGAGGGRRRRTDRLVVGEIDPTVLRKLRMQRNTHESARSVGKNSRNTRYRSRIDFAVAHDPHAAGLFGDQHVAVRKEHHTPRPH